MKQTDFLIQELKQLSLKPLIFPYQQNIINDTISYIWNCRKSPQRYWAIPKEKTCPALVKYIQGIVTLEYREWKKAKDAVLKVEKQEQKELAKEEILMEKFYAKQEKIYKNNLQ